MTDIEKGKINTVHHMDNRQGMAALPEKCASLIIADPPYFEVKGDFDFVWKSFDEYLEFMEEQAKAYKRILAENGTLYVYGHSKKIAYVQVIFDKYFGLVNSLVWEKAERDGLFGSTGSEQLRSFPNSTERVLMYSNDQYNLTQCVYHIRDYIRATIMEAKGKVKFKDINAALGTATNGGGVASACLSLDKAEPTMFTAEMYGKLQLWCPELRREYEELRREFNNFSKSTEVLKFRFVPTDHDHDTVKPDSISNCLVMTSSRKGDLVVIPFAGSGSECVAAKKRGRDFIGFDTELKYVEMANERVRKETAQKEMF
jgi:site-specific DNA-methyltransferase (adenine-specific)